MPSSLKYAFTFALLLTCACDAEDDTSDRVDEVERTERDAGRDAGRDGGKDRLDASKPSDAASPRDDGARDTGLSAQPGCREFVMPSGVDCAPPANERLPNDLRCTGLYGDFEQRELACGVLEYKPAFELWSDGAEKRRFVALPKGQKVKSGATDELEYPVGTRFWKEFRVRGANGQMRMAETRLLEKADAGWIYTSYVWSEDEKQALQMDNYKGVADLYGTGHVVPNRDGCKDCHQGRKDFVLGWDGIMLGEGASGVSIADTSLFDDPSKLALKIPGNAVERDALGYLHANCGISCHNGNDAAKGRESGLLLRLEAAELQSVQTTDAFKSGMNKEPHKDAKMEGLPANVAADDWVAIRPGDADTSLLVARQKLRGFEGQMPRIGTKVVDPHGIEVVSKWIDAMSRDAGYPAPAPLSR